MPFILTFHRDIGQSKLLWQFKMNSRTKIEQLQQEKPQSDPYEPSYPESAARFILYRIGITIFAVILVVVGKSNLPDDAVKCIEDSVINWMRPLTMFYKDNRGLGLTLMTIMQILVDLQLLGMSLFWYLKGNSFRYPIVLTVLGLSKVMLNILFQIRPIDDSFNQMLFPSLVFGQNFKNTYFFSGITAFLLFNLLQLRKMEYKTLMYTQTGILIFCSFLLLSMRQNFFMDVMTALVFAHFVFVYVQERSKGIDKLIMSLIDKQSTRMQNKG